LKLGIALGGGFARGLAHVGVLKVLEEEGIAIDYLAGTSVGSVIAAAFCSGVSAKELEEIAGMVRFRDFARWTLSRYGICNNDRMKIFLPRILKVNSFEELKIPLAVAATDFLTGEPVVFQRGPICDPVRASCAYPGMFAPVEIDGRLLVDGMLGHAVPTTPLREMGAGYVIGIALSAHWVRLRGPRHLFDVIGQCFSIAQARMSVHWRKDADLVLEPNVEGFGYDAFERSAELIANGERAMRAALPALKEALSLPGRLASRPSASSGAEAVAAVELAPTAAVKSL
jgi:NTE family protein